MLKKLVVPMFALSLAGFGCSSSSNNTTDARGGSGGGGGSGGAGGARDGAANDGSGLSDAAAAVAAMCPAKVTQNGVDGSTNNVTAFSAADFCTLFLDICSSDITAQNTALYTSTTCPATYMTTFNDSQKMCRSYHLCLAEANTGSTRSIHCLHTQGTAPEGGVAPCP
jgi:hypothetical protein